MDNIFIYTTIILIASNIVVFSTNKRLNDQITRLWNRVQSMAGIIVEREREIQELKQELQLREELTLGAEEDGE